MYICLKCKTVMSCEKNGVGARFGTTHVYPADRYVCKECGQRVLVTNERPIHDENGDMFTEYEDL